MPARNDENKEVLSIRVPPEVRRKLEALAERERRSLSNFVTIILEDWVKANADKRR